MLFNIFPGYRHAFLVAHWLCHEENSIFSTIQDETLILSVLKYKLQKYIGIKTM